MKLFGFPEGAAPGQVPLVSLFGLAAVLELVGGAPEVVVVAGLAVLAGFALAEGLALVARVAVDANFALVNGSAMVDDSE